MYRPYGSSTADSRPFLDVQSVIRNSTQDFVTAFNTGNFDHAAALYAPDGAIMAPNHEPAYGPKAVENVLRKLADDGGQELRLETTRVEVSADMAMEMGRYSVGVRQPDGTLLAERGKYVKVWRRLGGWLMIADCWSTNLPAADRVGA
jgi:ketosteroid isomerase-like protein